MTARRHLARFGDARTEDLRDPHTLGDDRLQVLWVMEVMRQDEELGYLTPAEISDILREAEGIDVSRQRVAAILSKEKRTVAKRRRSKRIAYKIMRPGSNEIAPAGAQSLFIDPEQALSQIRNFEEVLRSLQGSVHICDPYIENRSLDYLAEMTKASEIKLLSSTIFKESTLRRDLGAFQREHGNKLEVRIAKPGLLHDRYIIHKEGMLLLGTSLNGFAKNQSFVVTLGPDLKNSMSKTFSKNWSTATKFT